MMVPPWGRMLSFLFPKCTVSLAFPPGHDVLALTRLRCQSSIHVRRAQRSPCHHYERMNVDNPKGEERIGGLVGARGGAVGWRGPCAQYISLKGLLRKNGS